MMPMSKNSKSYKNKYSGNLILVYQFLSLKWTKTRKTLITIIYYIRNLIGNH